MRKQQPEMNRGIRTSTVSRYNTEGITSLRLEIAREFPLTILLNGEELVTLLCSPMEMKCLAAGYLASEGIISVPGDVKRILLYEDRGIVRVETRQPVILTNNPSKRLITTASGRGASRYAANDAEILKITTTLHIRAAEIIDLVDEFQRYSELYAATHGVHSAALCDKTGIVVFFEDVGRHNAFDKIFGKCLLEGISLENKLVITSGRMSSDSVYKMAKRNMPLLVSVASPTDLAVKIAGDLGMTLAGRVTKSKVDVYTHADRIIL